MFIADAVDESPAGETIEWGHAPHYWCNCTLTETGPDDRAVGSEVCRNTRTCFED
jgi:hypothetical protein